MRIFDFIPENYFSVLSSPNKDLYIDAILFMRETFMKEMSVSKNDLAQRFIDRYQDDISEAKLIFDDEEVDDSDVSSRAHFIIRKLEQTGWIEFERNREDLEEYIIFKDYSMNFANAINDILEEKTIEYSSFVFSTYRMLKDIKSFSPIEAYKSINEAYKNTNKLIESIRTLFNNLGAYHKKLLKTNEINEIAKLHFDDYKIFSDNIIQPLVTKDSVPRYKNPIEEMVNDILMDNDFINSISEARVKENGNSNLDEEESNIRLMLSFIYDTYEYIDGDMDRVKSKNGEYVRAMSNRINYLLTSDEEVKGKIIKIIKKIFNESSEEQLLKISNALDIKSISDVSDSSLYIRKNSNEKREKSVLKVKQSKVSFKDMETFAEKVKDKFPIEALESFVEKQKFEGKVLKSENINLNNLDDLLLLILITIRAKELGLKLNVVKEPIIVGDFEIPNIEFIKI